MQVIKPTLYGFKGVGAWAVSVQGLRLGLRACRLASNKSGVAQHRGTQGIRKDYKKILGGGPVRIIEEFSKRCSTSA